VSARVGGPLLVDVETWRELREAPRAAWCGRGDDRPEAGLLRRVRRAWWLVSVIGPGSGESGEGDDQIRCPGPVFGDAQAGCRAVRVSRAASCSSR
jgi:hypothetical protein